MRPHTCAQLTKSEEKAEGNARKGTTPRKPGPTKHAAQHEKAK